MRLVFKNLGVLYRVANNAKNAVKKVSLAVDKLTTGLDTDEQHARAEIESAKQELKKVESSSNAQSEVAKRVIELHKTKVQDNENKISTEQSLLSDEASEKKSLKHIQQQRDIYEPLKGKLTDKEILLIRRAFTYMTLACPLANKDLLEQLKLHAINQLKLS